MSKSRLENNIMCPCQTALSVTNVMRRYAYLLFMWYFTRNGYSSTTFHYIYRFEDLEKKMMGRALLVITDFVYFYFYQKVFSFVFSLCGLCVKTTTFMMKLMNTNFNYWRAWFFSFFFLISLTLIECKMVLILSLCSIPSNLIVKLITIKR